MPHKYHITDNGDTCSVFLFYFLSAAFFLHYCFYKGKLKELLAFCHKFPLGAQTVRIMMDKHLCFGFGIFPPPSGHKDHTAAFHWIYCNKKKERKHKLTVYKGTYLCNISHITWKQELLFAINNRLIHRSWVPRNISESTHNKGRSKPNNYYNSFLYRMRNKEKTINMRVSLLDNCYYYYLQQCLENYYFLTTWFRLTCGLDLSLPVMGGYSTLWIL